MIPPNAKVQRHAKQQQVPLNFSCRQAARCAAAQLPGGCQLYTGVALGPFGSRQVRWLPPTKNP